MPLFLGRVDGHEPLQRQDGALAVAGGIEALGQPRKRADRDRIEPVAFGEDPFVEGLRLGREAPEEAAPRQIKASLAARRVRSFRQLDELHGIDLDALQHQRLIVRLEHMGHSRPQIATQAQQALPQILPRLTVNAVPPQEIGQDRAGNGAAGMHGEVGEQSHALLGRETNGLAVPGRQRRSAEQLQANRGRNCRVQHRGT